MPVRSFHPAVREWFSETFQGPTRVQELAWAEILAGRSALVSAPTGSGKTLAAFLSAIDRLMFAPEPARASRCRVLYVSPLRALAFDVERNLRTPLEGIARAAQRRGDGFRPLSLALRTGDTPARERARMTRTPPDVLITTPESLFLVLTSRARAMLASVEVVIVDEIHALVGTKRGAHLALSLERLEEIARRPLQRIGLSATQRPLETVARFLGGGEGVRAWKPRPVSIVDAGSRKLFDLRVEVPVEEMARVVELEPGRSIWPAIHPRLLELVRAHRSTILFTNSRRLAERMAGALNELAGEDLARAHHGSLAREQRVAVEDALKAGRLRAIVATSSLELGIDMGAVDLVIQIEAPPSVASGMQRIGRGGHQVEAVSRGILFPKYRGDLLSTAALTRAMAEGAIEETRIPRCPLDVLAQQLVAAVAMEERRVDDLFALARRAAPYAELKLPQLEGVLDMLAGRYPSDEFAELRPRVTWDRRRGTVRGREGAKRLAVANAGTIPDRGLYGVFLAEGDDAPPGSRRPAGRRVGELDEEMVFESRVGDVFVLGASSWRIVEITRDRVLVSPAPGVPGRMPFWKGDRPPRPVEVGLAIGRLTRELASVPRERARERLVREHALDARAADNLLVYLADQKAATGALPDDHTLVLERTRDEMGDWRLCLLSPWGGRVHAPWALALQARLRKAGEGEAETIWSDDGIVVRLPDRERPPEAADLLPDPEEIQDLVVAELPGSALFAATFREAAGRALLLPRRRPGQRAPLWMQRKRAADLMAVAARYSSFPIVLESFRECLQDVFDLPSLVELSRRVARRELRLVTVDTEAPSPFAASLLFSYVANYLYDGDAPLLERRAQALSVDQRQLKELLGEAELRELLDPGVLAEVEAELQCLGARRRARGADGVHDLLLRLGDLSLDELRERTTEPPLPLLEALLAEGRVIVVARRGEDRYAAVEDAGRLRDAVGVEPPAGLPPAFLGPVSHALDGVVARYARSHGPFLARDVAARYGTGEALILAALERLAASGRIVEGEFRPGLSGREWCDASVLRTLRQRSLAHLRRQVEPAEPEVLGRLLLDWQGVVTTGAPGPARHGPDALLDVVEQIQGAVFPASALESDILPARLPEYRPQDLDVLCAAGEVVWVGMGPLGERDGRVSVFLADDLWLLRAPALQRTEAEGAAAIREHLSRRGASFFAELHAAAGGGLVRPVLDALWDLVWAGEVTSDTPSALRAFLQARPARDRAPRRGSLFRSRRHAPPSAAGRWSLLAPPPKAATPTERALALSEQLLARHGVLTRATALAEDVPGGFAMLYPLLRAAEEAGRVRRGYFLARLGGSQFAEPGALERLRSLREAAPGEQPRAAVLAATDPANPYGAALPWPEGSGAMRAAGSHVVIVDGILAAHVRGNGREVRSLLPEDEPRRSALGRGAAAALFAWCVRSGRSPLGFVPAEDGALADGPLAPHLLAAGFVRSGPGFRLPAHGPVVAPDEPGDA